MNRKFMKSEFEGWFYKIENNGKRSASFTNIGNIGKKMWIELQQWLSEGNALLEFDPIKKSEEEIQESIIFEARAYLEATDWKIIRHRDQLELEIETSLSSQEYMDLLQLRQEKRDTIMD